ncbi:MAG: response regulator [Alphaproteobacteria bacterium]|nr:response regulator [Alphaproteobacteria bacterium]
MSSDLSSLKISIVDNSPFMRKLVRRILVSYGIAQGADIDNGTYALQMFHDALPDIVILDVDLEPLDGIEITRFIRQSPDSINPYLPIIMMVGNSDMRRVTDARDAGATEIIAKPVSGPSLYGRIMQIIGHPREFVRSKDYFGPDRRRRTIFWVGRERRIANQKMDTAAFIEIQ